MPVAAALPADTERLCYSEAEKNGFEAFGVMPCHVIGPLLCKEHGKAFMWQTRIGDMLVRTATLSLFFPFICSLFPLPLSRYVWTCAL